MYENNSSFQIDGRRTCSKITYVLCVHGQKSTHKISLILLIISFDAGLGRDGIDRESTHVHCFGHVKDIMHAQTDEVYLSGPLPGHVPRRFEVLAWQLPAIIDVAAGRQRRGNKCLEEIVIIGLAFLVLWRVSVDTGV